VILAHLFRIGGFHVEYLLLGIAIAIVGLGMLRRGTDALGGRVMTGMGVLLAFAAFIVG
jgi:hypothetical protein